MANLHNIAESQWKWDADGHAVSGLLSDGIIVRKVTGINVNDLPALVEVLRLRSSVNNPDNGKRYRTVKDPMVGGKEQEGTWYSVNVKHVTGIHNPGRGLNPAGTIIQTLALWKGSLNQVWTQDKTNPSFAAEGITEAFSHIPHAAIDAYKTTLETATSGYKVSGIRKKIYEDGYGDLIQTQEKLFDGAVSASNGVDTEKAYSAIFADASVWPQGVFRTTTWIGVPDANVDTAMATLATAPSGYYIRNLANNYNGTGSCTIIRTIGPDGTFTAIPQAVQFPSYEDERRTYWHLGTTATAAYAKYISCKTTCDAGYKVDSVDMREYQYEMILVIQQISKLNLTLTGNVQLTDYTKTFGLVNIATTTYLHIATTSVAALKATILGDATKLILRLYDDDAGQGRVNVTCVWRSKESDPTALGAIRSSKPSQFHQTTQERVWVNVNLVKKVGGVLVSNEDALKDAVALAMAGTAPYTKDGTKDVIIGATGDDAGDKTGIVRQTVVKKPGAYSYADFSLLDSFNPHGLKEATMETSVREYPEVAYDDLSTIYAALVTFLGAPIAKGRVQTSLNGNGTFAIRAFKEGKPDWDNTDAVTVPGKTTATYNKVDVKNPGIIGQEEIYEATGVPVASAATIVNDTPTVFAALSDAASYNFNGANFIERGNGEAVIRASRTLKNETAVIVRNVPVVLSGSDKISSNRDSTERIWPLVTQSDFSSVYETARTTANGLPSYEDDFLDYIQADLLGNGMWRISTIVVKCPETTLINNATIACNDDSDVTLTQVQDATNVPTVSNASPTSVRLSSFEKNRYGKYDYTKITTTHKKPVSAGTGYGWTSVGETYWVPHVYNTDGTLYQLLQYQRTYIHAITFHATATAAAGAISGGYEGSRPNQISPYVWMAHKVTLSATQSGFLNTTVSPY